MDEIDEIKKKLTDEQKVIICTFNDGPKAFEGLVERSGFCKEQVSEILDELIAMELVKENT